MLTTTTMKRRKMKWVRWKLAASLESTDEAANQSELVSTGATIRYNPVESEKEGEKKDNTYKIKM
jgi:hypothetical protein